LSDAPIGVTGADGFIGRAFCRRAVAAGRRVRRFVRVPTADAADCVVADLTQASVAELAEKLDGVATLIHLAGRAHVMHETARDPDAAYRDANERATRRIAGAAQAAGVRRIVFASSVKVNGEATLPGRPFRSGDAPAPQDAYARSKLAAERALMDVAQRTAIVLRLPLVYGPGAGGNFRRLVDAVRAHRWLPLGAIDNRRSLLGLDNLLDALDAAIDAPAAACGVHFVADAQSVSTPALVRAIARALQTSPRLVPVPVPLLRLAGSVVGQRAAIERLTASLEVDTASFAAATPWRPRAVSIDATTVAEEPSTNGGI
jgi:nucleoside-diphosphate-sugar epimerase